MQRMPMPMSISNPLQPQPQHHLQHLQQQVQAPPSSSSGGERIPFLVGSPPSSSTTSSRGDNTAGSSSANLPTSVRGAAPALRRLIRKRQNSESAKRCRQRKKIEDARAAGELATQGARIRRLEAVVTTLCGRLEGTQTALAQLCVRSGICTRCAGVGCATCSHNSNNPHINGNQQHNATSANISTNNNNINMNSPNNVNSVSPIGNITIGNLGNGPYSPSSVQGADASALAAKVDEIAGWN